MTEEKKKVKFRKIPARQILLIGGAFILGFIILGAVAISVWDYSNSVAFCGNFCHDVHPEEIDAFQDSYHASIKCVECHMGRVGTIHNIFLKASHFRHLPEVIFDQYDRPLESETLRPVNESCYLCHWPESFHGDRVVEVKRYQTDEENTEKRTYLILKTAAGTREKGLAGGVHWHIVNPVEYIAGDEHGEEIRWVRTTLPDGRTIEYNDVTNPLTPEEIAAAEKKVMDCVDCHNRVGHPFPAPEELADRALADGQLSSDLPFAKQYMLDLLSGTYTSQEEAVAAVKAVKGQYVQTYPDVAAAQPEDIEQAEQLAEDLITQLVFEEPGVSWQNFPDQSKHKDFPGCFRCHNGKHLSADGTSIRLHCNICHNTPETVGADDRPPAVPLAYIQEPASHLETNFIADHRFLASDECASCHGEVEFGADDSSFCANSSCHGRSWPYVELDAAFPHPIELEGKHAEVWCHDCHAGVEKPEYECANCHQPPSEPHFGEVCQDCHTPEGWEGAALPPELHPVPLEGAHAELPCAACHASDAELEYKCANCHQPPPSHFGPNCEDCHTPTSFGEAKLPADMHPIELVGAHQTVDCAGCHVEGQETPEYVCSNCHEPPENHLPGECDVCHTPQGFVESASMLVSLAPRIEHEVAGREDCLMCHDPAGQIKPAPSGHASYANEQCVLCHKPES